MTKAFFLSFADLFDGRVLSVVLRALIITLLIFAGLGLLLGWALTGSDPCGWFGGDGGCELGGFAGGFGALFLTFAAIWFLYPAIAFGVMWGYADRIIAAVEVRHYPAQAAAARAPGLSGMTALGFRSALRLIVLNLIALPFYILLLVTGVGTVLLFVLVNGIAFGRDLGEMVAYRHGEPELQHEWLRATRGRRATIGMSVAAIVLVPILGLLAPAFGAIWVTHLHHGEGVPNAD